MESRCCKPISAPRTLEQCSFTHAASIGSSRVFHDSQGACQGGGGEQSDKEVDRVGMPVAKKQHIKSFSMGPAQHRQFHCIMAIHFMRSPSSSWSALRLSELSLRKQLHTSSHAASSRSTSTSTNRRF